MNGILLDQGMKGQVVKKVSDTTVQVRWYRWPDEGRIAGDEWLVTLQHMEDLQLDEQRVKVYVKKEAVAFFSQLRKGGLWVDKGRSGGAIYDHYAADGTAKMLAFFTVDGLDNVIVYRQY